MVDINNDDPTLRQKAKTKNSKKKKDVTPDSPSSSSSNSSKGEQLPDELWILNDQEDSRSVKSAKSLKSPRSSRRKSVGSSSASPSPRMRRRKSFDSVGSDSKYDAEERARRKAQRESHKAGVMSVLERADSGQALKDMQDSARPRSRSRPKRRSSLGPLSGSGSRGNTDSPSSRRRESSVGPVRRHRSFGEPELEENNNSRRSRRSRDIEAGLRAGEEVEREGRRSRRMSHRSTDAAAQVLERASSGKSLKELADESRRRRSNSLGAQARRRSRSSSAKPKKRTERTSVAAEAGVDHSKRLTDIEAQIKAEEEALRSKV